jgi:hypothetical protein
MGYLRLGKRKHEDASKERNERGAGAKPLPDFMRSVEHAV